jgi:hypothetical protein
MLHPALSQALATAHIEDLQRAAARWHAIRSVRRVAQDSHMAATSNAPQRPASTLLRGLRAPAGVCRAHPDPRRVAAARVMERTNDAGASLSQARIPRELGQRPSRRKP